MWTRVTDQVCRRMQEHLSALGGWDYWAALSTPLSRKRRPRIGFLYEQWLRIKEDGVRQIRSQILEPTSGQAQALASYEAMLESMRAVVRTAKRGDGAAYRDAYVEMVPAIAETRDAFEREGAPNICNFPI